VTTPGSATRKWKCRVCGYIYEGDNPPAECPICHKDSSYFDEIE
jgi:rubrerythrin